MEYSKVSERTAGKVAERQEAVHNVTQEAEVSQQVGAVGPSVAEHCLALPVGRAQFGITEVPDVRQEVEDIPQSASCRREVRGQRSGTECT